MTDVLSALQGDFKLFLQALWGQLDLPEPTKAQYAIAEYLQSGPKRLQIQAFRGVGKSWITGAFVLWTLFNNPEKKIMIISASKERADNMSIFLSFTAQVRRCKVVADKLRCELLPEPGAQRKKRGHHWTANRKPRRFNDSRRH
jgi:hypothetical protein